MRRLTRKLARPPFAEYCAPLNKRHLCTTGVLSTGTRCRRPRVASLSKHRPVTRSAVPARAGPSRFRRSARGTTSAPRATPGSTWRPWQSQAALRLAAAAAVEGQSPSLVLGRVPGRRRSRRPALGLGLHSRRCRGVRRAPRVGTHPRATRQQPAPRTAARAPTASWSRRPSGFKRTTAARATAGSAS